MFRLFSRTSNKKEAEVCSYSFNFNHGPSLFCLHFARALRERPLASVCPWLLLSQLEVEFKAMILCHPPDSSTSPKYKVL